MRTAMAPRSRGLLVALAATAVAVLAWLGVAAQDDKQSAEQQRDGAVAEKQSLAVQIRAECASGDLQGPICVRASEIGTEPARGPQGPVGPGPTPEQIRAAVESYMVLNPPPAGRPPTPGEVAAAVTVFLTANPPEPGRPPTAAEIATAVQTYFASNPPPSGKDGQPGRPPTADEIRAAVDAYFAENPPPAGPKGEPGRAGAPGPACPDGYVAAETGPARGSDGTVYERSITCVDPDSARGGTG